MLLYVEETNRGGFLPISEFVLYVLWTVPSGAPFVSLETSPDFVMEGDDVNVTCTVLGEPEVEVDFDWIYPAQVGVIDTFILKYINKALKRSSVEPFVFWYRL